MENEIEILPFGQRGWVYIQRKSDGKYLWPDGRWLGYVSIGMSSAYYASEQTARQTLAKYHQNHEASQ